MKKPKANIPPPEAPAFNQLPLFRPHGKSLGDWRKDNTARAALREILAHPVLQEAFQTLSMGYLPSAPPAVAVPSYPGGDAPETAALERLFALKYAHSSGFFAVYNGLANLASDKLPPAPPEVLFGELKTEPE